MSFTVCENETVSTASMLATPIQPAEWENNSSLTADEFAMTYGWFSFDATIGMTSWSNAQFTPNGSGLGGVQYIAYLGEGDLYMNVETDMDMETDTDLGNPKITGFQYRVNGEPENVTIENLHIFISNIQYLNPKYIGIDNSTIMLENSLLAVNTSQVIANGESQIDAHIANKFGMSESTEWQEGESASGSADTTPQLYTNEYATDQMLFTEDNNSNPLDQVLPMDALDSITITVWQHPVGSALIATWDGNDTWVYNDDRTSTSYNIVYDSGLGGFLVNYPRAAWENAGDEDLNIFFSWGGSSGEWVTTTNPLYRKFIPEVIAQSEIPSTPGINDEYYELHIGDSTISGVDYRYNDSDEWDEVRNFELGPEGMLFTWNADGVSSETRIVSEGQMPSIVIDYDDGEDQTHGELSMDAESGSLTWNGDVIALIDDISGGGSGSSYTAGEGIEITANDEIQLANIERTSENPEVSQVYTSYTAPNGNNILIGFDKNYSTWDLNGTDEYDNPVYEWHLEESSNAVLDSETLAFHREDAIGQEMWDANYYNDGLSFNHEWEEPYTDPDTGDDMTELKQQSVEWNMNAIQLIDQSSGDVYSLSINNGQIVLTNISL